MNPQLALAADLLAHTGTHIFLTGRAGTGKTTFLHDLVKKSPKRMVVVAPTGVAAINAGGVTMHSFFQLPFGVFIPGMKRTGMKEIRKFSREKIAIIRSMDLLVIDEISMVRADMLDGVDEVLRRYRDRSQPFGGVQLLMIGDLQQLAPVVKDQEWSILKDYYRSPYFFDSLALQRAHYVSIELRHIYRQRDRRFIELLSRVRDNDMDAATLEVLNARHIPGFQPDDADGYITLSSHNATARAINDERLAQLPGQSRSFEARVLGDFPESIYPVDFTLELKEGAQVMFAKNDSSRERRYVNGTIGIVTRLEEEWVEVTPTGGKPIAVEPAEWENTKYTLDPETNQITQSIIGGFRQLPLKTAWAITIHKSQGLTFERAIIDAADSFSHGQVYVALSRCRTLEGIVLRTPLRSSAIISDATVGEFTHHVEEHPPTEAQLDALKRQYYEQLLGELFDFGPLHTLHAALTRFAQEHLRPAYPKLVKSWEASQEQLGEEVKEVGLRFRVQLGRLIGDRYATDPLLSERISKGAFYFLEKCGALVAPLAELSHVELDNKETKRLLKEHVARYNRVLRIKLSTLAPAVGQFHVNDYLTAKSQAIALLEAPPAKEKLKTPEEKPVRTPPTPRDVLVPELYEHLREWRLRLSRERNLAAFQIASSRTLIAIANTMPATPGELHAIRGVGKGFLSNYAADVLAIIAEYRDGKI